MARRQKVKVKDLRQSGKFFLASIIVEGLLLAPETTIKLGGKDIRIGGIIPLLQNEIATGVRDGLDRVLPKGAKTIESKLRETGIKEKVTEKVLWFVYDYMEQFTLNSIDLYQTQDHRTGKPSGE